MMASAPCATTMVLFSEIGPPADLSVELLLNLSQPPGLRAGSLNENRTPFSVTVSLDSHSNDATGAHAAATRESEATPALTAVGEEPGCAVAEADAEDQSRVMATTATITAVAAIATLAALFMLGTSASCSSSAVWRMNSWRKRCTARVSGPFQNEQRLLASAAGGLSDGVPDPGTARGVGRGRRGIPGRAQAACAPRRAPPPSQRGCPR